MKKTVLCMLILLQAGICSSQNYYPVDLSKSSLDQPTISLKYKGIQLVNKLPKGDYKVKIRVEQEMNGLTDSKLAGLNKTSCMDNNGDFKKAYNALESATDEKTVPALIASLKANLDAISAACKAELAGTVNSLIDATKENEDFTFDLEKNQNIFVTITRINDDGTIARTWTLVLATPRKASYISHFGFTFSPNFIKSNDTYYAKKTATDEYTISKLNSNGDPFWKDLSLTANFILPFKEKGANVQVAWMMGFGVSGDAKFTVFTGPTLLHTDFMSLGLGFGVRYDNKLKGEYETGQKLKEALTFDQLHERGIRPTILLTLSCRLSKKQLTDNDIENIK